MFVIPPPPSYPRQANGGEPLQTNNTIAHPTGPEFQLLVGEEAPPHNPNPLATQILPPTAGTKVSLAVIAPRQHSYPQLFRLDTFASSRSQIPPSIQEAPNETPSAGSNGVAQRRSNGVGPYKSSQTPVFGEGNPAFAAPNGKESKDPSKRRKPKNNIVKSNSSFVSRVIPHETLSKRLSEHTPDGLFMFANVNRALQWLDMSSANKEDQLTKILFTKAHPLCHDTNPVTRSATHIDVIMGFSTGDIIWYEPMSQKYARLNKNGAINGSAVSEIKWLPNSENLFLAAHMDGSLVVYDKEKEDAVFTPEEPVQSEKPSTDPGHRFSLRIRKSVQSKNQKTNPVSYWSISSPQINAFAFSPDSRHLAVVAEDGSLRVIDYLKEQLLAVYMSYYGGLMCVCWSPDGRFIVTGGQDDLVSIWSLEDSMLVARCQGHNSWVTGVAFDPWRCDERNYRFGSVGEDCRLLLWDFSVGTLHRPRAASMRPRGSVASQLPRLRAESTTGRVRSNSNLTAQSNGDIVHPVEPRARTAMLPAVMAKPVDDHPLSWLGFEEDCIITACKDGHIRVWDRPKEGAAGSEGTISTSGSTANL
ncbi:hypothetical protein H2199_005917 [Coniosporium tulheliwenetii]|uniref:Uncharacterized protein n=1 Tax=Coniosporium tulheliwenetii TaxID=3383036 RepID=A0ACC2YZ04_9PEZI|nr:hypothetical protein H2199_005917 [Cladosporium sp. JES 115]